MERAVRIAAVLLAMSLWMAGSAWAADRDTAAARVPVLLELFTSEACSSCPPADKLLADLDRLQPVAGAELVVLGEHVDYFNQLGWKDRFSSAQFTARQQDYAATLHLDGPYTPQLIVDGQAQMVGSDSRGALSAVEQALKAPKIPITIADAGRREIRSARALWYRPPLRNASAFGWRWRRSRRIPRSRAARMPAGRFRTWPRRWP